AATHLAKSPFRELPGDILTSIRRQNRGRANGLFMDSIDIFIRLVKKDDNKINKALRLLFRRIYNGQVRSSIIPYLNNTYLCCLYKDVTDPTQLRPIGVPTAIRRIITNHVANATRTGLARHLAPINLAVGVNGGMDFIVKASQLATERYITGPQCRGEAPTRSFVSLDLVNMFNEVSREVMFYIIRVKFPHVLPLVVLLYRDPGTVFFKMADGTLNTQTVEEGLNQGCLLSAVLAALVLQEVVQPILDKLNHRAATRRRQRNKYDDGAGGESHPMAYIDDLGVFIPHEDLLFFLTEFHRVGPGYGCSLNTRKTRVMTLTSGASAIPAIALQYGQAVADQVQEAINKFSCKEVVIDGTKVLDADGIVMMEPHEVCDGLCLLGQPIGSLDYTIKFFDDRMAENAATATKLLEAVPDHQTALRLFSQCTLHKLPHLLGSEVLYRFLRSSHDAWNRWSGPLAVGIDEMANNFLAKLTQHESIPHTSLLIAYISVAQGGLGMMDAMSRAIPDFLLTMAHATRFAKYGISFDDDKAPLQLPRSLGDLFCRSVNVDSKFLENYDALAVEVAVPCAPKRCTDQLDYLEKHGLFKSARDRLKQAASTHRRSALETCAPASLKNDLDEILIASSSYPLIAMSRSNPSHHKLNDLFIINLKMKLHLPLFPPGNATKCLCGVTIDPHGKHIFCCRRVSKMACHNRVRDGTAPIVKEVLTTAGFIGSSSRMEIEPRRVVEDLPSLRPFDMAFRPVPSFKHTHIPPCPFTQIGVDVTITSPKGHVPPSRSGAASN
ncbi:hypothetical protein ACHAXR_004065, partial [Thalassiosira sp. AJA248-18]